MKPKISFALIVLSGCLILAGCGTTANLAGLGVSLNVAQKGQVAALTLNASTNAVTVGASYAAGTNSYAGVVTVPTTK